jgi:hypothetical protein
VLFYYFLVRYSRSSSISDLSSKIEQLSGSPKRTRLQALEPQSWEVFAGRALAGRTFASCTETALAYEREADTWEGGHKEETMFSRLATCDTKFSKTLGPSLQLDQETEEVWGGDHWPHSRWRGLSLKSQAKSSMLAVSWLRFTESCIAWKDRLAAIRLYEKKFQRSFLALSMAAQLKPSATTLSLLRWKPFTKDKTMERKSDKNRGLVAIADFRLPILDFVTLIDVL